MRDQVKHRLEMDDYLSALMDRSKNLKSNIGIYNDKLISINSKLSTVTHTSNFIYKFFVLLFPLRYIKMSGKNINFNDKNQKKHVLQKQKN